MREAIHMDITNESLLSRLDQISASGFFSVFLSERPWLDFFKYPARGVSDQTITEVN
jgi:hypothetical protein